MYHPDNSSAAGQMHDYYTSLNDEFDGHISADRIGISNHKNSNTLALTDDSRVAHGIVVCNKDMAKQNWRQRTPVIVHPDQVLDDEEDDERDSHDSPSTILPLHHTADSPSTPPSYRGRDIWKQQPRLTLSAFRRPETAIRLTTADPSRRLEDVYDRSGTVLGHGAFATVRLAVRRSDGQPVAIKSIAKYEALRSRRLRRPHGLTGSTTYYLEEWEILAKLRQHSHVVNLLEIFETADEIQLVTEYCSGGELFDAIQKTGRRRTSCSEHKAAQITRQMLLALADVHAAGIVHRDVKPENILIQSDTDDCIRVKLCDFGVARPLMVQDERTTLCVSDGEASPLTPGSRMQSFSSSPIGSSYYAAPELSVGGSYGAPVDIYSLGVTLYILLCGFPPIFAHPSSSVSQDAEDDNEHEALQDQVVLFPETYWSNISDAAKDLLRQMLDPDATIRVTARTALSHPWLRKRRRPFVGVDLDLVRDRLTQTNQRVSSRPTIPKKSTTTATSTLHRTPSSPPRKVRRVERRSSTAALMALADLCRTAPSVFTAGATVPDTGEQGTTKPSTAVATLSF